MMRIQITQIDVALPNVALMRRELAAGAGNGVGQRQLALAALA